MSSWKRYEKKCLKIQRILPFRICPFKTLSIYVTLQHRYLVFTISKQAKGNITFTMNEFIAKVLIKSTHFYLNISVNYQTILSICISFLTSCYGRNRNHTVVWMFLILAHNRFETVTQYFPIRRHSYMLNDRDFEHLKAKLRVEDLIFIIRKFVWLIASVRNVEEIHVIQPNDIFWWPSLFEKNCATLEIKDERYYEPRRLHFNLRTTCNLHTIKKVLFTLNNLSVDYKGTALNYR